MNKKIIALTLFFALIIPGAIADEGMWLVNLIDKQLYELMKSKGLELKPGEIYNPEQIALTDAIVAIDGGMCSGSIISDKGLMITNHHCAYGDIHALSTNENNYLEDGFWAMSMDNEKPIKGKSVTFLRGISDVTNYVNRVIDSLDSAGPRGLFFMNKVSSVVEERYKDSPYEMSLSSKWRGTKYYLYFYETFSDVRLVGAPPTSIGAFGGETDNWGWPQHKGDFAIYRVYTAADGSPASYSDANIPMQPKRFLTVSSKGVEKDHFTMILGYPGRTNRYISSFELKEQFDISNPIASNVRRAKLDVWKKHMDKSDKIRLKYSDKYFGISNYTDYAKWNNLCIERFDVIEEIKKNEAQLTKWIDAKPERVKEYGDVLNRLETGYELKAEAEKYKGYFQESMVRGAEFVALGQRFKGITYFLERKQIDTFTIEHSKVKAFCEIAEDLFATADVEVDRELFKVMVKYYLSEVPESFYAESFVNLLARFNGDSDAMADYIYDNSLITDLERMRAFFSEPRTINDLMSDPVIDVINTMTILPYNKLISSALDSVDISLGAERTKYVSAMYQMQRELAKSIYPDANSTMRLTFGTVDGIKPRDAVKYDYLTTTQGILEKADPDNYEFKITPRLEKLLKEKEWGRWGKDGVLYVNFMSDNDITGGNSGSGVLNGKGELVGLAFDGNRESMAGDVYFVEGYNKCVNVDIRYVLWVIDKYAEASYLIDEMEIN
ncbi:MAG: S46 family peptidase [Bacteroidales bacterium]|nr:S46 family peptidase [Bacteroidales bacterium]